MQGISKTKLLSRAGQLRRYQQGFLSMVVVGLLVMAGMVGAAAAYMHISNMTSIGHEQDSTQALFIAEAGLQRANYHLVGPVISSRLACRNATASPLTGNASVTNATMGPGTITVINNKSGNDAYYPTPTTLTTALAANTTLIRVASNANYAPQGFIMIDRELIQYQRLLSSTYFYLATRGVGGTTAAAHAAGSRVAQYQCELHSTGSVPNATSPRGERRIQSSTFLQEGWAVARDGVTWRFNGSSSATWTESTTLGSENLRGIDMLNTSEGWIVGDRIRSPSNAFNIYRWNPTTQVWDSVTGPTPADTDYIRDLNAVSAVSRNEVWAVGDRSNHGGNNRRFTILHWTGSQWCLLETAATACTTATIPGAPPTANRGQHLRAVHVIDTNNNGVGNLGFAVGDSGTILQYDGSTWTLVSSPTSQRLNAVFVVSASEAWAAGNNGTLLKWNGTTWQTVSISETRHFYGIHMLDTDASGTANEGWVVGRNNRAYLYQSGTWTQHNTSGVGTIYKVHIVAPNDVWALGRRGAKCHWNAVNWECFNSGSGSNKDLFSGIVIGPREKHQATSTWQEEFR